MSALYHENIYFNGEDFTQSSFTPGEYEQCQFVQCNFSGISLALVRFVDCVFEGCNLSNVKLSQTAFRDVQFKQCKMLGLLFDNCQPFGLSFSFMDCNLNHSSFYGAGIKKTMFRNCQLQEVDFSGSDLSEAIFEECNLLGAIFSNTNLQKADLATAVDYTIDPTANRLKKARFGILGLPGLLRRFDIVVK